MPRFIRHAHPMYDWQSDGAHPADMAATLLRLEGGLDADWQPESAYLSNARRAIAMALFRAYSLTWGDGRPSEAILSYFRDTILTDEYQQQVTLARLDRLMSEHPPITTPRIHGFRRHPTRHPSMTGCGERRSYRLTSSRSHPSRSPLDSGT